MVRPNGCSHYIEHNNRQSVHLHVILPIANLFITALLDNSPFPDQKGEQTSGKIKDMAEFAVFARRLTVPYYEQARLYFHHIKEENRNILNLKTENLKKLSLHMLITKMTYNR